MRARRRWSPNPRAWTATARSASARSTVSTPEDRSYLNYDEVETLGSSTEIPVLVVPAGKRIEFEIASADVIHGFWVPEFLFKRDVLPNPEENNSDNVFQVSEIFLPEGQNSGAFVGRCTEMCGTYHSMMNFELRVVQPTTSRPISTSAERAGRTPRHCRASVRIRARSRPNRSTPAAESRRRRSPQASR